MKNPHLNAPAAALACLFSLLAAGCESAGPNQQRGAAGGAALGAVAGALIGNNNGSALGGAAIGAVAGAAAGGAMGRSQDNRNAATYTSEEQASTDLYVTEAPPPPPPQSEAITPRPTANAVWVSGYWTYDNGRYLWTAGHWEIPPGNYRSYHAPHWRRHQNGYVYVRGYWR